MPEGFETSTGQLEEVLAAIAKLNDLLLACEWRRKCLWLLAGIKRKTETLQVRFSGEEQTFREILEPLDCYTNLMFESPEDLHTVFTCLSLVASAFEEIERAAVASLTDLWRQVHPLIDDLGTLDSGDPPSISVSEQRKRDVAAPELRDAERTAVRKRFEQRSRDEIRESFTRREKESEEYY
jgi:hypothetical protein